MSTTNRQEIIAALESIRAAHGGILRPEDVVAHAAEPTSVLHTRFEWSDSKAAHEYRLWQARHLIRVCVTVLPQTDPEEIKAYVSLKADREAPGGGYRALVDVLKDDELRRQLLSEALEDLKVFQAKYEQLQELAPVFKAAKEVRKRAAKRALPAPGRRTARTRQGACA